MPSRKTLKGVPEPPSPTSQTEKQTFINGGVDIKSRRDLNVGNDVVGRDKITNNIVTQHFYSSQDLQIGYLPPALQYELVDHKTELKRALNGLKDRKAVLLCGIGGVGKPMAAHVAFAIHKEFKDGVSIQG
jgi:hypothetical protein